MPPLQGRHTRHQTPLLLHLHQNHLKPLDLWNEPVAVAELLQQWEDALAAAGGGLGTPI